MSNLTAFLAQNAVTEETVKYVASIRFLDEKKKPIKWELKRIDSQQDEELRKTATKRVAVNSRRGQYTSETDFNKYLALLVTSCVVFPDLNSKELQDSYGVLGAEALIKKMLVSGEYANLVEKVQEINGFDIPLEDKVEEAKN